MPPQSRSAHVGAFAIAFGTCSLHSPLYLPAQLDTLRVSQTRSFVHRFPIAESVWLIIAESGV